MNIKHFAGIETLEQLKKEYRKLAKKYHPDISTVTNATEIMKEVNKEYDYLFKQLQSNAKTWQEKSEKVSTFKDIINALIKYDDINIDIVGTWLYVYGKGTYDIKEKLQKELKFRWSSKHKKYYYFQGIEKQKKKYKRRSKFTYNDIINRHGRMIIKTDKSKDKDKQPLKPLLD